MVDAELQHWLQQLQQVEVEVSASFEEESLQQVDVHLQRHFQRHL